MINSEVLSDIVATTDGDTILITSLSGASFETALVITPYGLPVENGQWMITLTNSSTAGTGSVTTYAYTVVLDDTPFTVAQALADTINTSESSPGETQTDVRQTQRAHQVTGRQLLKYVAKYLLHRMKGRGTVSAPHHMMLRTLRYSRWRSCEKILYGVQMLWPCVEPRYYNPYLTNKGFCCAVTARRLDPVFE